ncbi:hypothetical protein SprV_0902762000 [Sparganum proliferum]
MEAETQGTSSSPTDGTTQPQAQPGKRRRKARPQVDMPTDYARILEIIQSPYLGHHLQRKGLLTRKVLCRCRKAMPVQPRRTRLVTVPVLPKTKRYSSKAEGEGAMNVTPAQSLNDGQPNGRREPK